MGRTYGKLTVIREMEQKNQNREWLCQCQCGSEPIVVAQHNLRAANTTSCGCVQKERTSQANLNDLTNQTFGKLTVINRIGVNKHRKPLWQCKCACGNFPKVTGDRLVNGGTTSCGCARTDAGNHLQQKLHTDFAVDGVVVPYLKRKVRKDSKTGAKGVSIVTSKKGLVRYKVVITVKKKTFYIGHFNTLEEAIEARKEAEQIHHQPFIDALEKKTK